MFEELLADARLERIESDSGVVVSPADPAPRRLRGCGR